MAVISYPIPLYSNVPIAPQYYKPSQFFISAVTFGVTTIVTTVINNNYVIAQEVRLIIPPTSGCRQLNGETGYVLSIPSPNQVELSINSSKNVDAFVTSNSSNQPQILAIGDVSQGVTNANGQRNQGTFIPGSFQNISPL